MDGTERSQGAVHPSNHPPKARVRAAVVGVGSFGRHHARIYGELGAQGVDLVGLVDLDPVGPKALADSLGVPLVTSPEALGAIDVVSVAVPTAAHRFVSEPLLRRGIHCLVEKPAGGTPDAVQRLQMAADAGRAHLQVGMVERFNPVLDALSVLGEAPVYVEVQRLSPPTPRITDVGVVLDLMIHDLDLLQQIVGREVVDVRATTVALLGTHEDLASVCITFEGGCVAHLTASRVAEERKRTMRVFTRKGYVRLDCDRRMAHLVEPAATIAPGDWDLRIRDLATRVPQAGSAEPPLGPSFKDHLRSTPIPVPTREPLRAEIEAFLGAVRTGNAPRVTGHAAHAALSLAERILIDAARRQPGAAGRN